MKTVIVRLLSIDIVKENLSLVMSFVDEYRLNKAKRFQHEDDQLKSLGGGYLIQKYLPGFEVIYKDNQKPYIKNGPSFNISHSGKYIVFVMDEDSDIGVDIEQIDERRIDSIKYVLNEQDYAQSKEELFQLWTNKESLVKCRGTGIREIKKVPALPLEGLRVFDNQEYYTKSLVFEDYALSICRESDEPFEIKIEEVTI